MFHDEVKDMVTKDTVDRRYIVEDRLNCIEEWAGIGETGLELFCRQHFQDWGIVEVCCNIHIDVRDQDSFVLVLVFKGVEVV